MKITISEKKSILPKPTVIPITYVQSEPQKPTIITVIYEENREEKEGGETSAL